MEGKLSLYEQETVMLSNRQEKVAYLSTTKPADIRYYKKLAEDYPEDVKVLHEDAYGIKISYPKKWMKRARPPKAMSEETKERLCKGLQEYREREKEKEQREDGLD